MQLNLPENIKTYSTAYAGHQFGQWAGQLGDGRAIYAGEIKNSEGKFTEIQWKGAGATPYLVMQMEEPFFVLQLENI
jgi:uncharacterized protein YdiU (UPF0061 family)